MAPRRGPVTGLRAVTTSLAAAAILVVSLVLSSCRLSDAATAFPTPSTSGAPAPAPFPSPPPPPRQQATPDTNPGAMRPPQPPERHRGAHAPRAAPPSDTSSLPWHRRLNMGQTVGLALVAVAIAMQVVFVAYLAVRARQLRRAADAEAEWSPPRPAWQVARASLV